MEKGKIVAKEPSMVSLGKGLYFWCQCGLSEKQPFCDGSHKGSSFAPVKLQIEEEKKSCALSVQADKSAAIL